MQGRHETCRACGLDWNISRAQRMPARGYLCPRCAKKKEKGRKRHETYGDGDAGADARSWVVFMLSSLLGFGLPGRISLAQI